MLCLRTVALTEGEIDGKYTSSTPRKDLWRFDSELITLKHAFYGNEIDFITQPTKGYHLRGKSLSIILTHSILLYFHLWIFLPTKIDRALKNELNKIAEVWLFLMIKKRIYEALGKNVYMYKSITTDGKRPPSRVTLVGLLTFTHEQQPIWNMHRTWFLEMYMYEKWKTNRLNLQETIVSSVVVVKYCQITEKYRYLMHKKLNCFHPYTKQT